ncbi:unnamed protein product [Mytilus edulis]|uniref:Uncharacterized protein n=1 Tax=Mytilus edulis TaxID=6550 RepID=A0A8S3QKC7_MYTED|nr:unnamed protein product [Mytilus edulis]
MYPLKIPMEKDHHPVYVSIKGTNGAGLSSVSSSNGLYLSYLSQGLPPLSHIGIADVTELSNVDMASWDVSGDPCPVIRFDWLIQRLDGKVVMDWLNMGAGNIVMGNIVTTDTYLEIQFEGFFSTVDMLMYYVAVANISGEIAETNCKYHYRENLQFQCLYRMKLVSQKKIKSPSHIKQGIDKSGECSLVSHTFMVDTTPPIVGELTSGPDYNMENTPYITKLMAINNAGLSVSITSAPVLYDSSVPTAGYVVDGTDFKDSRVWLEKKIQQIGFKDPSGQQWSLTHRQENIQNLLYDDVISIKLARDVHTRQMFTGAYIRPAQFENGGIYQTCSFCNCSSSSATTTPTITTTDTVTTTQPPYQIVKNPNETVVTQPVDTELPVAQTACVRVVLGSGLTAVQSSGGFYIDLTPPVFDPDAMLQIYIDDKATGHIEFYLNLDVKWLLWSNMEIWHVYDDTIKRNFTLE